MATFTLKYTPMYLSDIVFANDTLKHKIERYAKSDINGPVLLHGPSNAGKTSIGTVLSDCWTKNTDVTSESKIVCYCAPDVSNNDIDNIRSGYRYKSIVLDRVHYLKLSAQEALVSSIERLYQRDGYSAILTTSNLQRVHPDLKDLCELIHIPLPDISCWFERAKYIIDTEGFNIPNDDDLFEILSGTNGNGIKILGAIEDYLN